MIVRSQITKYAKHRHVVDLRLESGDGYWYFIYDDPSNNVFETYSVYTQRLNHLSRGAWESEVDHFVEILKSKEIIQ